MNAWWEYVDTPPEGPPALSSERSWHATTGLPNDNEASGAAFPGLDGTEPFWSTRSWESPIEDSSNFQ